jgi:dynein heavy chain, axonemal
MKSSLANVQKALKGEVVMSEELEKMSNSIFDNLVPKHWQSITFLTTWIKEGTPKVFWISGFFFP